MIQLALWVASVLFLGFVAVAGLLALALIFYKKPEYSHLIEEALRRNDVRQKGPVIVINNKARNR